LGRARATVGFEADHVTVSQQSFLAKAAPKLRFKPISSLVEVGRMIKDAQEVLQLKGRSHAGIRPF